MTEYACKGAITSMLAIQGGGSQSTLVTVLSHPAPDVAVATVLITEAMVQRLETSMPSKHTKSWSE